ICFILASNSIKMNPSSAGWIDKFGSIVNILPCSYKNFDELYDSLKSYGFIYGINISAPGFVKAEYEFSEDENAKINLLTVLYFTYELKYGKTGFDQFLSIIFRFYQELEVSKISFLNKILTGRK